MRVPGYCFTIVSLSLLAAASAAAQEATILTLHIRHAAAPVTGARVRLDSVTTISNERGDARIRTTVGPHSIHIDRIGFADTTLVVDVAPAGSALNVALREQAIESEALIVTATRGSTVVADQPIRVVAVPEDEVLENQTVAPGSLTTLLEELPGVRLDQNVPGLGGAGLRMRGMPSRHTRVLIDNLPLLGADPDAFSLLQTPPLDLARVEVVPGIASALYGGSALGGVMNLVSKRPAGSDARLLLSQQSLGESDVVSFLPRKLTPHWAGTLTGGAHRAPRRDLDRDGWAEISGYRRAEIRPRVFYSAGSGNELLLTAGYTAEDREGGSASFREALDTRRFDVGMNAHELVRGEWLLSTRASVTHQSHDRTFGSRTGSDTRTSALGEITAGGTFGIQTWVAGAAVESDALRAPVNRGLEYSHVTPGVFVQDEIGFASALRATLSARVDRSNVYGTFFSPRLSALYRASNAVSVRASAGTGWAAPHPLIEEVEAVGLDMVLPLRGLHAEQARGVSVDMTWRVSGMENSAAVFATSLEHPLLERTNTVSAGAPRMELYSGSTPRTLRGAELLTHLTRGVLQLLVSYTYLDSWEDSPAGRRWAERVPKHAGELGAILERESLGRVGVEAAYSGRMRIENDPFRQYTRPFWEINLLAAKAFGETQLYVNALNLFDIRQSKFDPLLRPAPTTLGQRATEIWAPLAGRTFNIGLQLEL